jgi:predicted NBD/HSP70 family sugar kinase
MAEHLRGVAADASDAIYLTGEVGLGSGVIVGGRPLTGAGGYAGEVGHMSVNPGAGRLCTCGRRGCWETEVGADAVLRALGAPAESTPEEILAATMACNRAAKAAVRRIGRWLGVGVANLVNLFNPEVVVLSSWVAAALGEPLVAEVREAVARHALPRPMAATEIVLSPIPTDPACLGAATFALEGALQSVGQRSATKRLAPARSKAHNPR